MKAVITPGKAQGKVLAPPSKSMAHRMLIGAGLANGISVIRNIELSEDIRATLGILKVLGCDYTVEERNVTIKGIGENKIWAKEVLDSKESGSTLRFFIPLLLTGGEKCAFTGAKSLFARPLNVYEEICKEQNIAFVKTQDKLELDGKLQATHYKIPGNISSQFITGLLYALPLLEGDSVLEIIPPIESKPYIEMTLEALKKFGISIEKNNNTYLVAGNQTYHAKDVEVEGDYSNAAFLEALNVLGGNVEVLGLNKESLQGDKIYQTYFSMLSEENPEIDISECPDLGPILMGIAAIKNGALFTGTRRLKIKESDRGSVMAMELEKFGIHVDVMEDAVIVQKGRLQIPKTTLHSHNDHRIAMTLTTICTLTGGEIEDCMAVKKSYPSYYETLQKLGVKIDITD